MCALNKNNVQIKSRTNPAGHFLCLWSHSHVWCWTCIWSKLRGDNVTKSVIINTQLCSLSWCVNLTVGQQEVLLLNYLCDYVLFSSFFLFHLHIENRTTLLFYLCMIWSSGVRPHQQETHPAPFFFFALRLLLSSSAFWLVLPCGSAAEWLACAAHDIITARLGFHRCVEEWDPPELHVSQPAMWHIRGRSQCDAGVMEDNSLSEQTVWPRVREEDWKERV